MIYLTAMLEYNKWAIYLLVCNKPFLDSNFTSNTRLEWQEQHSPVLLSPNSIASMLRSRYPVFSLPAMHSLEANKGRSEEEIDGGKYEEGDEIAHFLWMAVRTVVVVEDGPGRLNWYHNMWHTRRRSMGCHIS